jgi:cytochrome c-type protein NapB
MSKFVKVAAVAALLTTAAFADTAACAGCHGKDFEKKAMNVSKVVKDMSKEDIVKALKGYKDGSYGGAMKALMKGQVAKLDDAAIEALAAEIKK